MNATEAQFVEILSSSIRGKSINKKYSDVNWIDLINLSRAHKVEGLIYPTLGKMKFEDEEVIDEINKLKKTVFMTGVREKRKIQYLSYVFSKLNEANIPIIVLKGLVVRNLYPHPEQRSMCDADILIHKNDLEKVKFELMKLGYMLTNHEASHHIALVHKVYPMIEVHWNIVKKDGFSKNIDKFEQEVWKRAIRVSVGNIKVLSLCYEDLLIHLSMHMAAHLAASGFGLRQVSDFVLVIEHKREKIDWNRFTDDIRYLGFEKFSLSMMVLSNILFDLDIPLEVNLTTVLNSNYIEILIDEIFQSGIYGKRDMTSKFTNQLAFDFKGQDRNATLGTLKRYLSFIFPPIEGMSEKYIYAKKNKLLVPVAWVQHLGAGITNKNYKISDKVKFITVGSRKVIKRNQLLRWLEL